MTDKRGESDQDHSEQPDEDQEAQASAKKFGVSLDVARDLLALYRKHRVDNKIHRRKK
jgi:hypothetical protein